MALLQESSHSLQHVGLSSFDISLLLVGLYGVDFLPESLDLGVCLGEVLDVVLVNDLLFRSKGGTFFREFPQVFLVKLNVCVMLISLELAGG
jgi:hypothetical protein